MRRISVASAILFILVPLAFSAGSFMPGSKVKVPDKVALKASQLTWKDKGLVVRQETRFPEQDSVKLTFESQKPVPLVCSFVGSEGRPRNINILVDGDKIATQSLEIHPTKVFDFEYQLPEQLTRGKQRITVKFQAPANASVGQVLDVRITQ